MNHLLLNLLSIYRFWKAEAWYLVFCSLLNQWTILTPVDNFRPAIIQKARDKLIGVENNTKGVEKTQSNKQGTGIFMK